LNEAEKLRLEAQKGKEDLDRRLSEIDDERREIIVKANEQAQSIVKNAQQEANEQRKNIIDKAEKEAEEIKERAFRELQTKIVSLAVAISSMILKEQIDKRKNEEIIRRAIDSLKEKGEL
jgi:F-type H+-transporting ATPase subunit b